MKICFTINSLAKGGAERVMSCLANEFIKENEIDIITLTNVEIAYELDTKIKVIPLGNKKHNSYESKRENKIIKAFKVLDRVKKMKKTLKKVKPDLIISFLPEANFITLLAKNKKQKIIISDRNDPKIEFASKIYRFLFGRLFRNVDGFVFQTEDAKEFYNENIDMKNKVNKIIYNPINNSFLVKNYSINRNNEIVSVGRLTEQKNFRLLIEAFSDISDEIPDYKLLIYGEGDQREELEKLIKEKNMSNKIILKGVTKNVKEKIYNASLFVLSSRFEGMPNALIEAMSLGLPVVATDCPCGGPKKLITNGENGFLVKNNNKKELEEAIKKIINDKELSERLQKNAIKIQKLVEPQKVFSEWKNIIYDVIRK